MYPPSAKKLCVCIVFLLVTGCQAGGVISHPTVPAMTNSVTTVTSATPRPSALSNDNVIDQRCPEISEGSADIINIKGTLIVDGRALGTKSGYKYIDLRTMTSEEFDPRASIPLVSPARNRIVYLYRDIYTDNPSIVIKTIGEPKALLPKNPDFGIVIRAWLDNERLVIRIPKNLQGPPPIDPPPHEIGIFNPFTLEARVLIPDYPDISSADIDWEGAGPARYDRTMDYVTYVAWNDKKEENMYALYQLSAKTTLTTLPGSVYPGSFYDRSKEINEDGVSSKPPSWSPDDTRVAVISPAPERPAAVDEIFAMTKSGNTERLTYFAKHFEKVGIKGVSWSPDGKSIAFWVSVTPAQFEIPKTALQDERLAILDTESFRVSIYCLAGDDVGHKSAVFLDELDKVPNPIWSPDGTQIIIEHRIKSEGSELILLDMARNSAVRIGEDLQPLGWMIDTPK